MKKYLLASMPIIGLAGSAFAANSAQLTNQALCGKRHGWRLSKIIGNKAGYASEKEAAGAQELPSTTGVCRRARAGSCSSITTVEAALVHGCDS